MLLVLLLMLSLVRLVAVLVALAAVMAQQVVRQVLYVRLKMKKTRTPLLHQRMSHLHHLHR
jgi:hypothetical protein